MRVYWWHVWPLGWPQWARHSDVAAAPIAYYHKWGWWSASPASSQDYHQNRSKDIYKVDEGEKNHHVPCRLTRSFLYGLSTSGDVFIHIFFNSIQQGSHDRMEVTPRIVPHSWYNSILPKSSLTWLDLSPMAVLLSASMTCWFPLLNFLFFSLGYIISNDLPKPVTSTTVVSLMRATPLYPIWAKLYL